MLAMFNKNWSFWGDNRVFILIIGLLVVIVGVYERLFLPVGIAILLGVYLFSRKLYNSKEAWFNRYLDTVVRNIERANNYAIQQLPIGIAVFENDGKLQWKNEMFQTWVAGKAIDGAYLKDILPPPDNNFETLSLRDTEKQIKINDLKNWHRYCFSLHSDYLHVATKLNPHSGHTPAVTY